MVKQLPINRGIMPQNERSKSNERKCHRTPPKRLDEEGK